MYKLLTDKLGNDTTEAVFKYIDNKTERAVEANIKALATKDDIATVRSEISEFKNDVIKQISEVNNSNLKWTFLFWIGQMGALVGAILLILKK